MDYDATLAEALDGLRAEGRYRVFMDILRLRGAFPYALLRETDGSERRITVWCGNDYLGMGQNPGVLDAMKRAVDGAGAGGTRNISGTTRYHVALEAELADLHAKPAPSCSPPPTTPTRRRCRSCCPVWSSSRMR